MKAVLGIVAVVAILAAGGVAAYDYTTGNVGILPTSSSCSSCPSSCEQSPACSSCCEQSEATEACPACTADKAECSACPSTKAAKECSTCPASAAPSSDK